MATKELTNVVYSTQQILQTEGAESLPEGVRIIVLPNVTDERGELCFMEGAAHIPFNIARVFFLHHIPSSTSRGDHSHRTCAEVVFAVTGAFTMVVDDGQRRVAVRMERPNEGILIPPGIWCKLTDFAEGTVCAVVASERFDRSGYTFSYEDYRKEMQKNE